jgi:hypothetical protein
MLSTRELKINYKQIPERIYLSEFDFRYNNRKSTDADRALEALKGFEGKIDLQRQRNRG